MKQQQMIEALVGWFLASEKNQEAVLKHDRENLTEPPRRRVKHGVRGASVRNGEITLKG